MLSFYSYTSLGSTWLLNMSQSSLIPKTLSPDLLQKACVTLLLSELDSPEWYWEFSLQVPLDSYNSALRISSLTQRICWLLEHCKGTWLLRNSLKSKMASTVVVFFFVEVVRNFLNQTRTSDCLSMPHLYCTNTFSKIHKVFT